MPANVPNAPLIHRDSPPCRVVFGAALALCFLLPLKFGDLVGVPDVGAILPTNIPEWIFNNWGDACFAVISGALMLAAWLFPPREFAVRRRTGLYAAGFPLLTLTALTGTAGAHGADFPAGEMVHIAGAAAFLLMLVGVSGGEKRKVAALAGAVFWGWGALLAVCAYQYFWGFTDMHEYLDRLRAQGDPVSEDLAARILDDRLRADYFSGSALAGMLMLLTPPALLAVWKSIRRFNPSRSARIVMTAIPAAAALGAFAATRSRGAYLALVLTGTAVLWCCIKSFKIRMLFAALAVLAIIGGSAYIAVAGRGFSSMEARADYYAVSAKLLAEHPLLGSGWGGFADNYMRLKVLDIDENSRDPHSMLATLAAHCGAGALIVGVLWLALIAGVGAARTVSASGGEKIEPAVWLLALGSFWLHAQMELHFQTTSTLAAGLAMGFFAFAGTWDQTPPLPRPGILLRLCAVLAALAVTGVSGWWLRAEYAYTGLCDLAGEPATTAGEFENALKICRDRRPRSAYVCMQEGDFYLSRRNCAKARSAYLRALEINPNMYQPCSSMARLELLRGNRAEAVRWAEKALEKNPCLDSCLKITSGQLEKNLK